MSTLSLSCSNGYTLSISDSNLVITQKKSEEIIPISRIQSFTLKAPGLSYGKITFQTAQPNTLGVNIGAGIGIGLGSERSFFYLKRDAKLAEEFRDAIIGFSSSTIPVDHKEQMVVSVVDEIRGLKSLLDDGIITQEEFDKKKQQLLNI